VIVAQVAAGISLPAGSGGSANAKLGVAKHVTGIVA
jgi:hypothetical protein